MASDGQFRTGDAYPRLVRLTAQVVARRQFSVMYRREQWGAVPVRTVVNFLVAELQAPTGRLSDGVDGSQSGASPKARFENDDSTGVTPGEGEEMNLEKDEK